MTPTNIAQVAAEKRLIRNEWSGTDKDGRELLCLYTALAGDSSARPNTCPANLCPAWLAHLTPFIDDKGSVEKWPEVVSRFVKLAPHLGALQGERSERLRSRCLAHIVREAQTHTDTIPTVSKVLELLDRHGSGGEVSAKEWEAAQAEAALWAAEAASRAAAEAALWAAEAASRAAAAAAEAALWATSAAAEAAAAALLDRIIDTALAEIEKELSLELKA